MSDISKVLQGLIDEAKGDVKELNHGRWTSSRLWAAVAAVVIVLFGAYFALQPAQLDIIAKVIIWFIAGTTLSKIAFGFFNAWMWVTARKQAGSELSDDEKKELAGLTPRD